MAEQILEGVNPTRMELLEIRKKITRTISEKIDSIITHPLLGFPIFLSFMWLTFQLTFTLGKYPMYLQLYSSLKSKLVHFLE